MRFLILMLCVSTATQPLRAQTRPASGAAITSWQRPVKGGSSRSRGALYGEPRQPGIYDASSGMGSMDHTKILARNDTTVAIVVTSVTLTACKNVLGQCGPSIPLWVRIKPGDSTTVWTIVPLDTGRAAVSKELLSWRVAPPCGPADLAAPVDSSLAPTRGPEQSRMVLPMASGSGQKAGSSSHITFFVNSAGDPDSVNITNVAKPGYEKTLRSAMMKYAFTPALHNGCPVPGTMSIDITF